jgi:hypothetical protein
MHEIRVMQNPSVNRRRTLHYFEFECVSVGQKKKSLTWLHLGLDRYVPDARRVEMLFPFLFLYDFLFSELLV